MKKRFLAAIFAFIFANSYAQNCQYLGADQYLPCGVTSTTITANFSQCSGGASTPPKETTTYLAQNIPFAPSPATGTQVFLSDDAVSAMLPIGFSFCFYGNTYTNFYIGSNGWISFSAGQPATFTSAPIPSTAFGIPKNCIMGPWQDWHPGVGGQIRYQTQGTAPCRRLVVSFTSLPFFSCTSTLGTFQIVLYEGTNIIENHITNKPACTQWAGGTAVQGIHNLPGTAAVTVPGRNSTAWTTTNNAWRYTPNGNNVTPTLTWYQVGNPTPIATNVTTITVTPPLGGAYYTATYSYTGCYANYMACVGGGGFVQDTVFVQPMMNQTAQFNQSPDYCSGTPIAPLPTSSINGITGTWSPAINNMLTSTYTFTPNPGQCADPVTQTITIIPNVTPAFTPVGPFCIGTAIPNLPNNSNNGIPGSWSPAINNQTTTSYTFTPSAGVCAIATNMTIVIDNLITPTFAQVGPYCSGANIPSLLTTSQNGFTGTWSPAINNTATTTYTFTPNPGQCAATTTMTVNITNNTTPTFAAVGPYCSGANIPAISTTSQNGITGTWSPAINNTATTTYTFTPTAGQCATATTMTITINPNITPTFAAVGPFCSGTNIPALPTTSINGYTGTWSPAINNTATTNYTFTPTAGQCATTTTLTITVNPNITPTFTAVGPFCSSANIPALPTSSLNGYTGTWSPAINNTATTTYTFTPTAGQCATTTTLTITVNPNILPTFSQVGPFCTGSNIVPLPTTSQNGFTGTWAPAINNTTTTSYTFTPTVGQCATNASTSITITPLITPTFSQLGPYCGGGVILAFPTTSLNGFTGTWSPAPNNMQTTSYTFTSNPNQCAANTSMTVDITPVIPSVTNISICQNELPYSWNGQNINSAGQFQAILSSPNGCDSIAILNLTLLPTLSSTTNVQICQNQIPYLWNGLSLSTSGTNTLTLTSLQGCDSLATLNLTVNPMPNASFTANYEDGCAPLQVTFSNSGGSSGTCQWNLGNGVVSSNCGTVAGTYNSFGCYDVSLQITSAAGCSSTLTLDDIVCVNPQPEASFVVNSQQLSNFDPTANFTNTSTGHVSQTWNFGDGSGTSTLNNPQHTYPEAAGYYYVTLVVANSHGCVDSTTQLIVVDNVVVFYVPNTFTPDGDVYNETFRPIFTAGFDIYQYQMVIFNRWGEIIFESNNSEIGWDGTYGGNTCQDGTYIWQITYKEIGKDKRNEIRGHFNLLR
jgi:gliding motility-associated-like protein